MKNAIKNSELTVLLISDNDADIREIAELLENTMGQSCHLWHCPSIIRSSGFFKKALPDVDIVLLDLDLVGAGSPEEMFRQMREIVRGIPIIVFTERSEHGLALMVVHEGAADNMTRGQFSTDPCKLRDAIEFALARAEIANKREQATGEEYELLKDQGAQDRDEARQHETMALASALAKASIVLERTIEDTNENLRQSDQRAAVKLRNAVEHGETLLAEARADAVTAIDQLTEANEELHREKDQAIHWLSGGYSIDKGLAEKMKGEV